MNNIGIRDRAIRETPIAIVDFETTGFMPKRDRIVELAVARVESEGKARLILDTLVNPERSMAATEIHGIEQEDVENAPLFKEIAGDLLSSLSDCVVMAYNASFDMRFLLQELSALKFPVPLPYVCLMELRPMLGLGGRCKLEDACAHHGIRIRSAHIAVADLQATTHLLEIYLKILDDQGIETFGQLSDLESPRYTGARRARFLQSFEHPPLPDVSAWNLPCCENPVTRYNGQPLVQLAAERYALSSYSDSLRMVLADLEVTDDELDYLLEEKSRLKLADDQVRALHARAFASAIGEIIDDEWLDNREAADLRRLHYCLSRLGWAPGE